jgi:hypothetical protein
VSPGMRIPSGCGERGFGVRVIHALDELADSMSDMPLEEGVHFRTEAGM